MYQSLLIINNALKAGVGVFVLFLSACASLPPYHQAQGEGYGYQERKISDNQYRIHFKAKGNNHVQAMDFALLRAAEVTLLEGSDWFVVTDRQSNKDNTKQRAASESSNDASQLANTNEVESVIEVRLGKGIRPANESSYSALEVKRNIRSANKLDE